MTGSLQIKNGKYYAVINLVDCDGKRKQKWISTNLLVKGNKKNAEKFLRDVILQYEFSSSSVNNDILFADYIKYWLDNVINLKVDIVTHQGYKSVVDAHLIPYFKARNYKLVDINKDILQEYINSKYKNGNLKSSDGLSAKSLKIHFCIIKQVIDEALKSNLIMNDPCRFVTLPKAKQFKGAFYNVNQIKELLTSIENEPLYPLIYFTVVFGLRRSEVLGLQWNSVDFENRKITIEHTVVKVSKVVEKDGTKNKSSCRSYPLTDYIIEILTSLKEKEDENRKLFGRDYFSNDYIFKWDNGKPYSPDYVSHRFKKLLIKYNLPIIRFHDLRHSCASLLIDNDYSLKDIQEWLGHSDIKTTANIYAHLDAKRKATIAETMSSLL